MKETPNFGLTIYDPNDVLSYLTTEGWNGTMEKIDTSMKQLEDVGSKNTLDLTTLEQQVSSDHDELNKLTGEVSDLTKVVSGNTSNINGLTNTINGVIVDVNGLKESVAGVGSFYTAVLSKGETTLSVILGDVVDNIAVDIYTDLIDNNPVIPLTREIRPATGGQPNLCVLTFDRLAVDLGVYVKITQINQGGGN